MRSLSIHSVCVKWLMGLFLILAAMPVLDAQEKLAFHFIEADLAKQLAIDLPASCQDSQDLYLKLKPVFSQLHKQSFLSSQLDSIIHRDSLFHVYIDEGPKLTWLQLDTGNVPEELLESLGINTAFFKNEGLNESKIAAVMKALIDHYANHGYPFAVAKIDSLHFEDGQLNASLHLQKNKVIYFDSINLISTEKISSNYLENLLQIKKGKLFDMSKIAAIEKKMKNLPFIRPEESPTVEFKGNRAIVHLKLKPRNTSRFDILIGILPDNSNQNKIRITGDVVAAIYNKLGQGEFAGFQYKSYQDDQQELSLELDYPFLFSMPFGLNSSFKLFRNTNANRDLHFDFGISYQIKNNQYLKVFWNRESSRLLNIDTASLIAQNKLPSSLDVEMNGLGLAFNLNQLNYLYNPRSGFSLHLEGTAGQKNVIPNPEIQAIKNGDIDFSNSYDTIRSGYQFSLKGAYDHFFPLGKVFALRLANRSGYKVAQHGLYLNESFRIGGSKIMRGFDEESLYATAYSIFTVETRLLIGSNSYFFVFGDYGWFNRNTSGSEFRDRPYGIGAGLSFDTGAGILLISTAAGSQMGAPLDLNSSKVHLGYVSLF